MTIAGAHHFTLEQGATFRRVITWRDDDGNLVNLTGYTARMQVRRIPGDTTLLELTTANGRISLGGSAGTITLLVTAAVTAALTKWPSAVYDLELIDGSGTVTRLLEGKMRFSPEVTV